MKDGTCSVGGYDYKCEILQEADMLHMQPLTDWHDDDDEIDL